MTQQNFDINMNNVFFLLDLQFILNERVIEFIFNKKSKQEL